MKPVYKVINKEINKNISAITMTSILLRAKPKRYTKIVNNCNEVLIFEINKTLVASLFLFLALKSLSAPTQISLVIITDPINPIK